MRFHSILLFQTCTDFCYYSNLCAITHIIYEDMRQCLEDHDARFSLNEDPLPDITKIEEQQEAEHSEGDDDSEEGSEDGSEEDSSEEETAQEDNSSSSEEQEERGEGDPEGGSDSEAEPELGGTDSFTPHPSFPHPPSSEVPPVQVVRKPSSSSGAGTGVLLGFLIVLGRTKPQAELRAVFSLLLYIP